MFQSGVSVMERVKREIFQSQAFDKVRSLRGGPARFQQFIEEKIEAVDGDIVCEVFAEIIVWSESHIWHRQKSWDLQQGPDHH